MDSGSRLFFVLLNMICSDQFIGRRNRHLTPINLLYQFWLMVWDWEKLFKSCGHSHLCESSITIFSLWPLFFPSLSFFAFLPLPTMFLNSFSKTLLVQNVTRCLLSMWLCSMRKWFHSLVQLFWPALSQPSSSIIITLRWPEIIFLSFVMALVLTDRRIQDCSSSQIGRWVDRYRVVWVWG